VISKTWKKGCSQIIDLTTIETLSHANYEATKLKLRNHVAMAQHSAIVECQNKKAVVWLTDVL